MRIVAIRGENLASLSGAFEVDLQADPLGQVGLFAITGPTGAGKSTLLDCACLALFDKVPRLRNVSNRSKVRGLSDEEDDAWAASDPRGLLRRGAGAGFAEVEFLDTDGVRFRARWSVHRARKRPDGRLQTSEMALYDAAGQVIEGGRKTDVLEAIEARLGLGFEQFRRSALLAQGEFAAFLHADPVERATVLERVTGTELYRRISEAVFERQRQERDRLQEIDTRLDEVGVLPAEVRNERIAERDRLQARKVQLEAGRAQASEALQWYREDDFRADSLARAGIELEAARTAHADGAADRELLERLRACEPHRATLQAADTAREAVPVARAALDEAREALAHAEARAGVAADAVEQAGTRLKRAREARDAAVPELERARTLDATLQAARDTLEARQHDLTEAKASHQEATAAWDRAKTHADAVQERLQASVAWLEAHPVAAALAPRWDEVARGLERLADTRDALARAEAGLATAAEAVERARDGARASQQRKLESELAVSTARKALDLATAAVAEGAREALAARRSTLESRRRVAERAVHIASEHARLDREHREHLEVAAREREAAAQATRDQDQARTTGEQVRLRLDEARETLDRLRDARSLDARRHSLVDGEPCPLCGATEHPWARGGAPDDALLTSQGRRVDDLEAQIAEARSRFAATGAEVRAHTRAAEQADARAGAASEGEQAHRAAWQDLDAELPETPSPEAATALSETTRTALDTLAAEEAALREQEREVERARADHEAAVTAERKASDAFHAAHDAQRKKERERERLDDQRAVARRGCQQVLEDLVPLLGDADDGLEDPRALREHLGASTRRAREHASTVEHARAAAEQASRARDKADARRTETEARLERCLLARTAADEAMRAVRVARRDVLDGRPTAEVARALDHAVDEADHARTLAREEHAGAGRVHAAAQATLEGARRELRVATERQAAADEALHRSLTTLSLDEAALRSRLAHAPDRVRALERAQEQAEHRLVQARTVHHERSQALARHRADQPPADRATVQQALEQSEAAYREITQRHADLHSALQADDHARSRATELQQARSAQRRILDTWDTLNDLVGSRDGRTFKRFAQSLTLDALLAHANRHLDDLAPRYRLVRVPGSELDLQVIDQELGDEVRGVHTLSGGETFLASLALALGLSSLSSADTPVETLFIDEGFGTLDIETLEVALAALDALQATGRQVGIISHVAALHERIGTRVRVVPLGSGRSRVVVEGR